jgi:pimeloyl-ACP methyl ester carboxylesterase
MNKTEAVILLHGIGLSKWSLSLLSLTLRRAGYDTINITYPSTELSLDGIAEWLHHNKLSPALWDKYSKIHFVTHSMGGLVARRYLNKYRPTLDPTKIGRVVMIGTPNQGSEIADTMICFPPYKWLFGPAGQELTTTAQSRNPDVSYFEAGIIAGTAGWLYPLSGLMIKGPHDGRVAVERTKLPDMTDHIVVRASHTMMVHRRKIHHQVLSFLRAGQFQR